MTDYRDPNYRDPSYRDPMSRDRDLSTDEQAWSNSTWGWIAGLAVAVLLLVFIFGGGRDTTRTANEPANPPATVGQRSAPLAPPTEAPTMNRPAPAPMAPPAPAAPAPTPAQPQP